jgi:hypothetical protein
MSDPKQTTEEAGAIQDRGQVIPPRQEIPSEDFLKATHDLIEVCRETNSTMQNKMAAYAAAEEKRSQNRVIDSAPDAGVSVARCITDITERRALNDWEEEVQDANNKLYIQMELHKIRARRDGVAPPKWEELSFSKPYERLLHSGPTTVRATANMYSPGGSGSGIDWAPIGIASNVIDFFRVATGVVASLPRIDMGSGTRRMDIPVLGSSTAVTVLAASTGDAAIQGAETISNPDTLIMILQPFKHATSYGGTSVEEIEDSTVNIVATLAMELGTMLAHGHESAVLSGQVSGATDDATNFPGGHVGYGTATTMDGLRPYGITVNANTTSSFGAAFDLDAFETLWGSLGNFGGRPSDLAFICPVKVMIDLMSDAAVRSMNTMGPTGTLPTGTIGFVHGIKIIPTMEIPLTDTNGVVHATAGNNTQQSALMVNTTRWRVGFKRNMEIKIQDRPLTDEVVLRGFARHAIGHAPPQTDDHVAVAIDIAP